MMRAAAWALLLLLATSTVPARGRDKNAVEVEWYGTSLCQHTRDFILQVLEPLMNSPIGSLVNLKYWAWGNSINTTGTVECQFGPTDCHFDRVINCAQALKPAQEDWFPLVACLASTFANVTVVDDVYTVAEEQLLAGAPACLDESGYDLEELMACAEGSQGDALDAQAEEATAALQPPKLYIPWVLANGIPLSSDAGNLATYVCAASTAKDRLELCRDLPLNGSLVVGYCNNWPKHGAQ